MTTTHEDLHADVRPGRQWLALVFLFRERRQVPKLLRDGFRAPYSELAAD